MTQRRALGGGTEHRHRRRRRADARRLGLAAGVRLVHAQVDDHLGIEVTHEVDRLAPVAGIDAVEVGTGDPPPRRVEVEAEDLVDRTRSPPSRLVTRVPSSPPIPVRSTLMSTLLLRLLSRLRSLGPQRREQDDVADRGHVGEQHHQPVDADAEADRWAAGRTRGRGGSPRRRPSPRRRRRPSGGAWSSKRRALLVRVDELAEPVAQLAAGDDRLRTARRMPAISRWRRASGDTSAGSR